MTNETILTKALLAELIAAVGDNLYSLFREMVNTLPGGELVESDQLSRHLTFPHNPMFKGVWRTRLTPGEVDEAIDETIAWFKEREAPFFFWWTDADTQPADLGEILAKRSFLSMEEQQKELARGIVQTKAGAPCMVADLAQMHDAALG